MIIFEDAFIPWERVFLCGETLHGSILAMLFALTTGTATPDANRPSLN